MEPGEPPSGEGREKAIEILRKLVEDHPDVPDYRYDIGKYYAELSDDRPREGKAGEEPAGAVEERIGYLQKAMEIFEGLVGSHPQVPSYAVFKAELHLRLFFVLYPEGRLDPAEMNLRRALSLQSDLVRRYPEVPSSKVFLAGVQEYLGFLLRERGELEEAAYRYDDASATLQGLVEENPSFGFLRFPLARNLGALLAILEELEEEEEAAEVREQLRTLFPVMGRPPGAAKDAAPPQEEPAGKTSGL